MTDAIDAGRPPRPAGPGPGGSDDGTEGAAGSRNDSTPVHPAVRRAAFDRVRADAACDSEDHHTICRVRLRTRSAVIPVDRRYCRRKGPRPKPAPAAVAAEAHGEPRKAKKDSRK